MNSQKKERFAPWIGAGCVWLGMTFGPGFASGTQIASYFTKFGISGLFTPVVAMLLQGLGIYFTLEFCRLNKTNDFRSWSNGLFAPHQKIMSILVDIAFLYMMILGMGLSGSYAANLLQNFLGAPYWVGMALVVVCTILLASFGSNLVREASTWLMIGIAVIMALVIILAFAKGSGSISEAIEHNTETSKNLSVGAAIWSAVVYAGFQATCICNITPVSDTLSRRSDSKKAVLLGFVGNIVFISVISLLMFSYTTRYDIVSENLPIYSILAGMGYDWITWPYVLLVVFAILSGNAGMMLGIVTRYEKYLVKIPMNSQLRKILFLLIFFLISIFVAVKFGIRGIVGTGYTTLGYLNLPIILIPAIVIGAYKTSRKYRKKHNLSPIE